MDLTDTIAPKSDQMDYEDLLGGERTFTVKSVRKGPSADQPVEVVLEEFPRPWRPAKSMRRLLVVIWGADASRYAGKKVRLFGDPTVTWGGQAVGGIRIRAMSDITEPATVALTVTRGRRAPFVVQPLDAPVKSLPEQIDAAIGHFERTFSVTVAQLEEHAGNPFSKWTADDVTDLRALAGQISRGEKTVGDVFGPGEQERQATE